MANIIKTNIKDNLINFGAYHPPFVIKILKSLNTNTLDLIYNDFTNEILVNFNDKFDGTYKTPIDNYIDYPNKKEIKRQFQKSINDKPDYLILNHSKLNK